MSQRFKKFLEALEKAQKKRPEKSNWLSNSEIEWMVFERETMLNLINSERKSIGKNPIDMNKVIKVENQAVGHFDYSRKFALYCSELVESDNMPPP